MQTRWKIHPSILVDSLENSTWQMRKKVKNIKKKKQRNEEKKRKERKREDPKSEEEGKTRFAVSRSKIEKKLPPGMNSDRELNLNIVNHVVSPTSPLQACSHWPIFDENGSPFSSSLRTRFAICTQQLQISAYLGNIFPYLSLISYFLLTFTV